MKPIKRLLALGLALLMALWILPPVLPAQAAGSKLVAITYDDGPSSYTPQLLDGLKQRGVKATFFMVGQSVPRYASTVERVYREGHQVANHSYSHSDFSTLSYYGVRNQVQGTSDLLDRACGKGTQYMVRPPYGSLNSNAASAAWAPLILWSVDPQDWLYRNAETVRRNIVSAAHDGAIILVHDIHATSIPGSLAAIDQLQAQGYEFVTVRELMRRRGVTPQDGVRYTRIHAQIEDPGPIAAPKITAQPQGGQLLVTLEAQPGTQIYYSTDGRDLNQESRVYTGPFTVRVPARIKAAAAYNMNGSRSETVEASFTTPCTETPKIAVADGMLTLSCATEGAEIFYSTGGEELLYTGPVPVERGCAITAWACRDDYLDSGKARAWYTQRGNLFADVPAGEWFYEPMDRAVEAGYFQGTGDGCFRPYEDLTRGQLVTVLYRFSRETAESSVLPFEDVPEGAYYREAVAWAYQKGMVRGISDTAFGPEKPVTRQEMSVILSAYLQGRGLGAEDAAGAGAAYSDWGQVDPWARDSVEQMTALGFLGGSGGKFDPLGNTSRAQGAAVLTRLEDRLK